METEVPSVPVTFVVNSFFDDLCHSIRSRPMPWEGYQRAALITEEELSLLRQAKGDKVPPGYITLLVELLNKLIRVDTLQYILVLIDDLLESDPQHSVVLHEMSKTNPKFPYEPFLKCLKKDDDFLALKAEKIISFLICTSPFPIHDHAKEFLDLMIEQLASRTNNVSDITVQLLQSLLSNQEFRHMFYGTLKGVPNLIDLAKKDKVGPQLQYQVVFCFWLLSFETKIAETIDSQYGLMPLLISIAKSTVKEKIIRVAVGTLKNLYEKAPDANINALLGHKVGQFVDKLHARKWTDKDFKGDLELLKEGLDNAQSALTTFGAYRSEVEAGTLEWSPPHQSNEFWKVHSSQLEANDGALLKRITELLEYSEDPLVLAVAAHDVGQFVKFCPNGKSLVERTGAKRRVMELMVNNSNADVKYHALLAVQNCLVHAWENH